MSADREVGAWLGVIERARNGKPSDSKARPIFDLARGMGIGALKIFAKRAFGRYEAMEGCGSNNLRAAKTTFDTTNGESAVA